MERLAKEILVNKLYLKKILFDFDLIMIKKTHLKGKLQLTCSH